MMRAIRFFMPRPILLFTIAWTASTICSAAEPSLYQPRGKRSWDYWFAELDGTYYAFYLQATVGQPNPWNSTVGLATSKDLIHWTEHGEVLHANQKGQWCDSHIATGSTWRGKDRWQMLFTACNLGRGGDIGLAESDDLKKWSIVGPATVKFKNHVVPEDPYWQRHGFKAGETVRYQFFADPYVLPEPIDGWYYMIANCGVVGRPVNARGCIGLMRGKDGRTWEDCGIISLMLDYDRPETPQLWQHGDRWYLYFGGAREDANSCRENRLYTSRSMRGPFEPVPRPELKLPDGRGYYIAKVIADPNGSDVFLGCTDSVQLSRPYPVQYDADGGITLKMPSDASCKRDEAGRAEQLERNGGDRSEPARPEKLYDERYRPQLHFSAVKNWLNDPNGMVFYKGEYHLFFQHNPEGIYWNNMTWGHAVSADMLHWKQLDHAIHPDELGMIYSGSAVVDWNNIAGFQSGGEKPIVCVYTSAGETIPELKGQPFVQSIAYSNDCGRTWTKYKNNPVLKGLTAKNRDPKVCWHAASKRWIMALYLEANDYGLFSSSNLKEWTKLCVISMPGASECPDFFELPVDGDAKNTKWVFWGADNTYCLGHFDGETFTKKTGMLQTHWGTHRYAGQTFSDIPATDGRRIQIAWMREGQYPGMPFNQQMSFPVSLTLRTFPEGVRLCSLPVCELDSLHGRGHSWTDLPLRPGENPLADVAGDLFDIRLDVTPGAAAEICLNIRGTTIQYQVKDKELLCLGKSVPVELGNGHLAIQVLVDRSSLEVFSADGRVNMAYCILPPGDNKTLAVTARGGEATIRSLNVWELNSTWSK